MGRHRKSNSHLPSRVYSRHGQYWYVDFAKKWHPLGKTWNAEAKRKWIVLSESNTEYGTIGFWFDAFLVHRKTLVDMGKLAKRTYADNLIESTYILAAFGKLQAQEVIPADIREYLDTRGQKAAVRANREKSLLSALFTWLLGRRDSGVMLVIARN